VYAVARDQEPRPHLVRAEARDHAVLVLADELDRLAALHLARQAVAEDLLELPLPQANRGRERAVDTGEVEPRDLPAAREERHARDRQGRRREHGVGDPGVVPELEAARVQVRGPGDGRALRGGVGDPVRHSVPLELAGEAEPDRAGAGDHHPDVHPPSLPPRTPAGRAEAGPVSCRLMGPPSVPFPR
jgi:hypothetical protein